MLCYTPAHSHRSTNRKIKLSMSGWLSFLVGPLVSSHQPKTSTIYEINKMPLALTMNLAQD